MDLLKYCKLKPLGVALEQLCHLGGSLVTGKFLTPLLRRLSFSIQKLSRFLELRVIYQWKQTHPRLQLRVPFTRGEVVQYRVRQANKQKSNSKEATHVMACCFVARVALLLGEATKQQSQEAITFWSNKATEAKKQ